MIQDQISPEVLAQLKEMFPAPPRELSMTPKNRIGRVRRKAAKQGLSLVSAEGFYMSNSRKTKYVNEPDDGVYRWSVAGEDNWQTLEELEERFA